MCIKWMKKPIWKPVRKTSLCLNVSYFIDITAFPFTPPYLKLKYASTQLFWTKDSLCAIKKTRDTTNYNIHCACFSQDGVIYFWWKQLTCWLESLLHQDCKSPWLPPTVWMRYWPAPLAVAPVMLWALLSPAEQPEGLGSVWRASAQSHQIPHQ